jgi:hypothetical protein
MSEQEQELTAKIVELGDQIKQAKADKKPKEEWDPFLQQMLELKVRIDLKPTNTYRVVKTKKRDSVVVPGSWLLSMYIDDCTCDLTSLNNTPIHTNIFESFPIVSLHLLLLLPPLICNNNNLFQTKDQIQGGDG